MSGPLTLSLGGKRRLKVLCLGCHSDDIEIGCGGTILELASRTALDVRWVVFSGGGTPREAEARKGAKLFLAKAKRATVEVHDFRDGFFPWQGADIKAEFERLKAVEPDVVFTQYRSDRHQDHRMVSDLTWNTFRNHLVLEYEIPKWDGDMGVPNAFVPVSPAHARAKVRHLMKAFGTQRSKRWFTPATFEGLLRLRGIESGAETGLAEAFYARKAILTV